MTDTDSVGKLGIAPTGLTEKRRFFRSPNQWIGAFLRFTSAALAVRLFKFKIASLRDEQQWSDHLNIANGSTLLAISYGALHRQSISHNVNRGDTELEAFRMEYRETQALAEPKLAVTLQRSGISRGKP